MDHDVMRLFQELADLATADRERYFAAHPIAPALRREVESLLRFDGATEALLDQAVSDEARDLLDTREADLVGRRCGAFRLIRLLGRGGTGAVYLAERADGQVEQRVAIKLLRPDVESQQLREHFRKERQILASLQHPGIARLLDAGETGDATPYLVMDYVDGVPIDVFAKRLDLRGTLDLFLRVCDAVSYAHRALVIHRDLKPSNILVDASGQPRLLDFGIAKLLDVVTDVTRREERRLTPDYASPEQIRGAAQTTATDVYSLGAVLYALLTGKSPHVFPTTTPDAIDHAICNVDPASATRLNPAVSRDLDAILSKALRKEPDERYASAEALADDIRAFLEWRPVRARSGNAWYRTRKFARRYRAFVAAAAITVAGLSAGLYLANRERLIAERRFAEVRQLANKLFEIDRAAADFAGSTKTRQLIVDTALQYLQSLAVDARSDPALSTELANAYLLVARVQGVPVGRNLGQMDQAAESLRRGEDLIAGVLDRRRNNREALFVAAEIASDRMILASMKGTRRDLARRANVLAAARALEDRLRRFDLRPGDGEKAETVLDLYMLLADQLMQTRQLDDALRVCRQASTIARELERPDQLGMFSWTAAQVFQQQGDVDASVAAIREAAQLVEPAAGETDTPHAMRQAHVLIWEGRILGEPDAISAGRTSEAIAALERAFRITDDVVHVDRNDQSSRARLGMAGVALGDILRRSDASRALETYDHTLEHLGEIDNNAVIRRLEVEALAGSAYALRTLHRFADARRRLNGAFERLQTLKLYPAPTVSLGSITYKARRALADLEANTGNVVEAIAIEGMLLEQVQNAQSEPLTSLEDAVDISNLYQELAGFYRRNRQPESARSLDARRLELWRRWESELPQSDFVHRQRLVASAGN